MTEEEFLKKFGHEPRQDDMHRVNCEEAGAVGHFLCGVCPKHDKARFMCGCLATRDGLPHPLQPEVNRKRSMAANFGAIYGTKPLKTEDS